MSNSNYPAFPTTDDDYDRGNGGLTKREYIATELLKSAVSNPHPDIDHKNIVVISLRLADELLDRLNGSKGE